MRKISAVCLPFQPLVKKVIPTDDPEVAFKVPLLMNYVLISRKNECLLHYNLISRDLKLQFIKATPNILTRAVITLT